MGVRVFSKQLTVCEILAFCLWNVANKSRGEKTRGFLDKRLCPLPPLPHFFAALQTILLPWPTFYSATLKGPSALGTSFFDCFKGKVKPKWGGVKASSLWLPFCLQRVRFQSNGNCLWNSVRILCIPSCSNTWWSVLFLHVFLLLRMTPNLVSRKWGTNLILYMIFISDQCFVWISRTLTFHFNYNLIILNAKCKRIYIFVIYFCF